LAVISAIIGVIWFERSGKHLNRTLINGLVSCFSCAAIQWFVFVQLTDIIRYFFSPQTI
jgi:hypothetical protein